MRVRVCTATAFVDSRLAARMGHWVDIDASGASLHRRGAEACKPDVAALLDAVGAEAVAQVA